MDERPEYLNEFNQPPVPLSSRSTGGTFSPAFEDQPDNPYHPMEYGAVPVYNRRDDRRNRKCIYAIVILLVLLIVFLTIILILWQRGVLKTKPEKLEARKLFGVCRGTPSLEIDPDNTQFIVPSALHTAYTMRRDPENTCRQFCLQEEPTCLSAMYVNSTKQCYLETGFKGGDLCGKLPYTPTTETHKALEECKKGETQCTFYVKYCECKSGSGKLNMRKDIYHGMCTENEDYSFDC